jgi:hypothetical protein
LKIVVFRHVSIPWPPLPLSPSPHNTRFSVDIVRPQVSWACDHHAKRSISNTKFSHSHFTGHTMACSQHVP